jgi:hypothetical protein
MLECTSAAALSTLIAWCPTMALFKPLDFGLVRFCGTISCSFYLLRQCPSYPPSDRLERFGSTAWLMDVFTAIVSIKATTPAAYLIWR